MLGAIIGDLAAWTYEHDKDLFYRQLVSDNKRDYELSVYSRALLDAATKNLLTINNFKPEPIGTPMDCEKYFGQWLMWQIIAAWMDKGKAKAEPGFHCLDKEEMYARLFVTEIIRALRQGATKKEAKHSSYMFEGLYKTWDWKEDKKNEYDRLLTYIFRAWDSFYRAFDYTSTIHNAVRWSGGRHLTAAIAGAFADAMYGCEMTFIKEKYAKGFEPYHQIIIDDIGEKYGYHHALIHEMENHSFRNRSFYPKNCALTNVEWHQWEDIDNVYKKRSFTDSEHSSILRSARTSWENRYGMYLDDGWIYLYRSYVLIGRFQMKEADGQWYIVTPQLSGEKDSNAYWCALECALYEGCEI